MVTDTRLVDDGVVYASPPDVFRHIRNKAYDDLPADRSSLSQGGLAQSDVDDLIAQASERADTYTKRAWRTRKVVDIELGIKLSHDQKHARHRRRKVRGHGRRNTAESSTRGFVDLPHTNIKPIDAAEDKVVILNTRSTNDVTDDEGRDDGSYIVSNRKGILRPDIRLLTPVGTYQNGRNIEDRTSNVRVSYRYGHPHDVTDYDTDDDGVSDYVPADIRDAVGRLVASRLIGSDQYGQLVPNAGDDTPSLSDAASNLESAAMNTLRDYRRV